MANNYCECGFVLYNTHYGSFIEVHYAFTSDKLNKISKIKYDDNDMSQIYKLNDFSFTICPECKRLFLCKYDEEGFPYYLREYILEKEMDFPVYNEKSN